MSTKIFTDFADYLHYAGFVRDANAIMKNIRNFQRRKNVIVRFKRRALREGRSERRPAARTRSGLLAAGASVRAADCVMGLGRPNESVLERNDPAAEHEFFACTSAHLAPQRAAPHSELQRSRHSRLRMSAPTAARQRLEPFSCQHHDGWNSCVGPPIS